MPEIEPPSSISEISFGDDAFALIADIDGRQFIDVLHETERGSFTGIFRVPFPSNDDGPYRFEFVQLWTRHERARNYVEIDSWDVALDVLKEGTTDSGEVLADSKAAKQRPRNAPRAVRRGYSIVLGAESRYTYGVITVAVEFGVRQP